MIQKQPYAIRKMRVNSPTPNQATASGSKLIVATERAKVMTGIEARSR